jgi:membrane protease YdiL (CAAX protease family)
MSFAAIDIFKPYKWKPIVTIVVSTLALVIFNYQEVLPNSMYSGLLVFLAIPLFVILGVFRETPANYGMQIGDWKRGLQYTAVGCLVVAIILWIAVDFPGITPYYAPQATGRMPYVLRNAIELLDWEFFFRGFLLFSLAEICGPYAILLQAVPFTLAHFGKPYIETISCIFGGAAFGYIAWRTKSFIYPYFIHLFLASFVIFLASR